MQTQIYNATRLTALLIIVTICLSGCAGVEFIEEGGEKDLGFRYYPAKPYVVIESGENGSIVKLLSLPDLSKPRFVKHKPGWGTAEFGFDTSNGMLTSFNAKSDSKATETMTAIAALGTANAVMMTAEAARVAAEVAVGDPSSEAVTGDLSMVPHPVLAINKAWGDLQTNVLLELKDPIQKDLNAIRDSIDSISNELATLRYVDYDSTSSQGLDDLVDKLAGIKKKAKPLYKELVEQRENLEVFLIAQDTPTSDKPKARAADNGMDGVIDTLATFLQTASSVEMYEILNVDGDIKLRKVRFTP